MPNIAIIMEQKQKKTYKKEQKSMGIGRKDAEIKIEIKTGSNSLGNAEVMCTILNPFDCECECE